MTASAQHLRGISLKVAANPVEAHTKYHKEPHEHANNQQRNKQSHTTTLEVLNMFRYSLADVRLRHLRQRLRRRAQMRHRLGQVLNATLYLIVVGGACVVLLSL